eukprot:993025-Pelagomonas_calceolata.AAC.2
MPKHKHRQPKLLSVGSKLQGQSKSAYAKQGYIGKSCMGRTKPGRQSSFGEVLQMLRVPCRQQMLHTPKQAADAVHTMQAAAVDSAAAAEGFIEGLAHLVHAARSRQAGRQR